MSTVNPNVIPKSIPTEMPTHLWTFPGHLEKIVDGDTIDMMTDTGLNSYRMLRLRLMGINAPEVKGPTKAAGDAATFHAQEWLNALPDVKWPMLIQTYKADDWGRYIAVVWNVATGASLNMEMLTSGNAVPYVAK
jgi:endonuclease YncB( thermonuclease family)